jgi:hypothetical protein
MTVQERWTRYLLEHLLRDSPDATFQEIGEAHRAFYYGAAAQRAAAFSKSTMLKPYTAARSREKGAPPAEMECSSTATTAN